MTEQLEILVRLYRLIGEKCDALPPCDYREAVAALVEELTVTEGAVIREIGDVSSVRLAGIRATSTQGILAALHNWRVAVDRKLMGGAA